MSTLRSALALILLAVWTVGGVAVPLGHDLAHSAEQTERASRIDETHSDHHHHDVAAAHGTEAQPYCPESIDAELACALCTTPTVATVASSTGAPPAARQIDVADGHDGHPDTDAAAHAARGPPAA